MNLVFLGDSLTEFFDWQKRFPGYHVNNLGVAGEPVEGLLGRTGRVCAALGNPDYIFIMTGINNIAMEEHDIIGPYRKILAAFRSSFPKAELVVQSVLPVNLPWVSDEIIRGTNVLLKETAKETGAVYLDLYSLFVDQDDKPVARYLLDDGVHLSPEGYRIWADAVERFISSEA